MDLLGWGVAAALAAAVVLGLTGGGWGRGALLGLLVLAAVAVLVLLSSRVPSHERGRRGPPDVPPGP